MLNKSVIKTDIEDYVCNILLSKLNGLFTRSKLNPKNGFRRGYGYGYKTFGALDIVPINASVVSIQDNCVIGRVTINTLEVGTEIVKKRFLKIIKVLDKAIIYDVLFEFEINCANGHSYWFKFTIQ